MLHGIFEIQATDSSYLNNNEVTTLIQHEGFRFWGSHTYSDNPLFAFEHYTRTSQVLADTMAEAYMWANDLPPHSLLATDIIEGQKAKLRDLKRDKYFIDDDAWFYSETNTKDIYKQGN